MSVMSPAAAPVPRLPGHPLIARLAAAHGTMCALDALIAALVFAEGRPLSDRPKCCYAGGRTCAVASMNSPDVQRL